jgi:hypothetical protein
MQLRLSQKNSAAPYRPGGIYMSESIITEKDNAPIIPAPSSSLDIDDLIFDSEPPWQASGR